MKIYLVKYQIRYSDGKVYKNSEVSELIDAENSVEAVFKVRTSAKYYDRLIDIHVVEDVQSSNEDKERAKNE